MIMQNLTAHSNHIQIDLDLHATCDVIQQVDLGNNTDHHSALLNVFRVVC